METRPYPHLSQVDGKLYADSYKGVNFIYMDFSNLRGEEGLKALDKWNEYYKNPRVVVPPEGEAIDLILVNGSGTPLSTELMRKFREFAKLSKKHIIERHQFKKAASYGGGRLAQIFLNTMGKITGTNIRGFTTREEALEWLVKD